MNDLSNLTIDYNTDIALIKTSGVANSFSGGPWPKYQYNDG